MEKIKVPALYRIMAILELLEKRGKCPALEIIESLGLPKSTTYALLDELKKFGLITQDSQGNYQLWLRLISLGHAASSQLDIREVARKFLYQLMQETGLLCQFGIMDGNAAYYILKVESHSTISVRSYEGKMLSLNRSGLGKCLLAWQPADARERIIRSLEFLQVTENSITDPAAFARELDTIRTQGWAFDNGEDEPGVRCVAAPVFGVNDTLMGAISTVGARQQVRDEDRPALVNSVVTCAQNISKALGWSGA